MIILIFQTIHKIKHHIKIAGVLQEMVPDHKYTLPTNSMIDPQNKTEIEQISQMDDVDEIEV